ncbi:uncharacterized protein LOC134275614 [Saccostrea cucullata]|uniref:uncharacterized protein LOC134275614 n=1 Tax=Saccostrea cuccullata TaxID=36930 RepID=UPI002ED4A418
MDKEKEILGLSLSTGGSYPSAPPTIPTEHGPSQSTPQRGNSDQLHQYQSNMASAEPTVTVVNEQAIEINAPPSYDDIFAKKVSATSKQCTSSPYLKDDRTVWEQFHECFEMSCLQQIIWLGALAFSISYIYYGLKFAGKCYWQRFNDKGKVQEEENLSGFIQSEGGLICATVLFALLIRLLALLDMCRKHHHSRSELEGKKKCGGYLFFIGLALYIANFAVCIVGATKIIPLDEKIADNKTYRVTCDPEFQSYYFNAKVGELSVLMPYAFYVLISLIIMPGIQKKWFLRRKWRQWVRLLDADQDGVISADDMEKTNAKLEEIRKLFGAKDTALSAGNQKKWWNENIFKGGPGKDISVDDYVSYLEGTVGMAPPHERNGKVKPMITSFFSFFSTEYYRKKNLIMNRGEFLKFWTILANVDEIHCRKMYTKHFPTPFTMQYFLNDFESFLANDTFFDEFANRIFNIVRYQGRRCCKV